MAEARRTTFLIAWRKHRGMTVEAAADAIGVNKSTLSRIERGLSPYTQKVLENLALLYGCDPAELLIQDPREETNIIRLWDRATADQRRALGSVAETMIKYREG
jgi:transcriptional regulator with XRE-family HTH domain